MVTAGKDRVHTFRIYLPSAGRVELAGDFTNWIQTPILMDRDESGWWTATAVIEPGEHAFSYFIDGERWMPDFAASGLERNSFGGWVSRLYVPQESGRVELPVETGKAA